MVDVADGHGNTLLSEAAAGGAVDAVKLLLGLGADPNTQGEFKRTPLWRAAFLGKTDCVGPLLAGGADPRIGDGFALRKLYGMPDLGCGVHRQLSAQN